MPRLLPRRALPKRTAEQMVGYVVPEELREG